MCGQAVCWNNIFLSNNVMRNNVDCDQIIVNFESWLSENS